MQRTASDSDSNKPGFDLSYADVAKWAGRSAAVIELYAYWFYDFITRREDRTFIAHVLNPRTELSLVRIAAAKNQPEQESEDMAWAFAGSVPSRFAG